MSSIKEGSLIQARQAYITESECIKETLEYFDEDVYSKAVKLLKMLKG